MATGRTTFKGVTKSHPCEVCEGDHKCSRGADGLILCGRMSGPIPGFVFLGMAKGDNQFAQYRRENDPVLQDRERHYQEDRQRNGQTRKPFHARARGSSSTNGQEAKPDLDRLARGLAANLTATRRAELAETLGLLANVLDRLPLIGYSDTGFHRGYRNTPCFTFPEVNAAGRIIGILCRYPDGAKKGMPGGNRGLAIVPDWRDGEGPVFLVEGPSDTLALTAVALSAIGRPSNTGGVEQLAELLKDLDAARSIVVVGEYDPNPDGKWPGRDGALQTATRLAGILQRPVFWVLPPDGAKDARKWVLTRQLDPTCLDEWHAAGDAWFKGLEGRYQEVKPAEAAAATGFAWGPIDSATFAGTDYRPQWLIKRLLVRGQPAIVGGPKKSLKTSLLVDLALSLASGAPFLGEFQVYHSVRVALLSGESGEFTLQETAKRIAQARGIDLAALGSRLLWQFTLPQLGKLYHMTALRTGLERDLVDVLILDPLYLALLAGLAPGTVKAENLFDMGPLMQAITGTCLSVGTTPVFIHHTRKGAGRGKAGDEAEPLDLDDLAFAGSAEFARQWFLINRREPYEPGTGSHRLWLNVGGSVGHGGLWSVDIEEGIIGEDFTGRKWDVAVRTATEGRQKAREAKTEEKAEKVKRQDKEDDGALLAALDHLDKDGAGVSYQQVREESRLSRERMSRACNRLVKEGIIERVNVEVIVGNGGKRPAIGLMRKKTAPETLFTPT